MKPVIQIEIVSDVVCPWCYIGKRRMEKAIAALRDQFDFDVSYIPFELNPQAPESGLKLTEYLAEKFGGMERYHQITQHVTQVAASEGLSFNFDRQPVSPNTREMHRVIWFAKTEGKQEAVKEAFMKAYFEDGIDLTQRVNILSIAASAGLSADRIAVLLDTNEGMKEVEQLEGLNYQRGISGVPFYILNQRYGISGAQPMEVFIQALTQLGQSMLVAPGDACDTNEKNCW